MPVQTQQSKFSFASAAKKHAKDKTDYGQDFTRLPGGITGGIAELISADVGTYKNGELTGQRFVRFAGTVIEPKTGVEIVKAWKGGKAEVVSSKEMNVEGLQTSVMFPICESKSGSAEANTEAMLNEMRKLGGPDYTEPLAAAKTEEQSWQILDQLLKGLLDPANPVRFKFGTRLSDPTAQYPNSRVWESWYGAVAAPGPVAGGGGVEDGTEATGEFTADVDGSGDGTVVGGDEPDLDALGEAAVGGDKDAQKALDQLAIDLDIEAAATAAESYTEVVELIRAAQGGTPSIDATEEPEPEPFVAVKGGVYKLAVPKDPKNTKKGTKEIDVEVTLVNAKNRTCQLKNGDTKKPMVDEKTKKPANYSWDELIVG